MYLNRIFTFASGRIFELIVLCLSLLFVSQILWIHKIWKEQEEVLRREVNYLFQQTVMNLQDTLVSRNAVQHGEDLGPMLKKRSFFPPGPPPIFFETNNCNDSSAIKTLEPLVQTATEFRIKKGFHGEPKDTFSAEIRQVQIYMTAEDSASASWRPGLGRILLNMRADSTQRRQMASVVLQIESDTIAPAELAANYLLALQTAGLPVSFRLEVSDNPAKMSGNHHLRTEPALSGLFRHQFYQAGFDRYSSFLLRKTLPYILFSLFLMGLTSLAFWLIFNNLKQQKRLAMQQKEFVSNVTHELKTPLTTVGVALEALGGFQALSNPAKTREYLEISKQELNRLSLLVDKVLRLSMFEQQALRFHPENVDLSAIIWDVIAAMTLQAKNAGAAIRFFSPPQPAMVFCDRLHLSGTIFNLLDNALKYRREAPSIDIILEPLERDQRQFWVLKVADNGIGIAPEFQPLIFDKFFRVPTGNTHNVKGHGLGLSYVAHVVREQGGAIRVESKPGVGSTFIVEIPAATSLPLT